MITTSPLPPPDWPSLRTLDELGYGLGGGPPRALFTSLPHRIRIRDELEVVGFVHRNDAADACGAARHVQHEVNTLMRHCVRLFFVAVMVWRPGGSGINGGIFEINLFLTPKCIALSFAARSP